MLRSKSAYRIPWFRRAERMADWSDWMARSYSTSNITASSTSLKAFGAGLSHTIARIAPTTSAIYLKTSPNRLKQEYRLHIRRAARSCFRFMNAYRLGQLGPLLDNVFWALHPCWCKSCCSDKCTTRGNGQNNHFYGIYFCNLSYTKFKILRWLLREVVEVYCI
jgi:hypothetical protein